LTRLRALQHIEHILADSLNLLELPVESFEDGRQTPALTRTAVYTLVHGAQCIDHLVQREAQRLQRLDEPNAFERCLGVHAVPRSAPVRPRQNATALVKANGVHADAGLFCNLSDLDRAHDDFTLTLECGPQCRTFTS